MFTYALLKAIRLEVIYETEYKPVAEKAYNGLLENFISEDASGNLSLNRICRSAGLRPASKPKRDGSADYYLDGSDAGSIVSNDLKGVGLFIMASVEFEMAQDTGNSVEGVERADKRIKVIYSNRVISIISESQPVEYVECYNLSGSLVFSSKGNSDLHLRIWALAQSGNQCFKHDSQSIVIFFVICRTILISFCEIFIL